MVKFVFLHDANLMDACYYGDNIHEVIDELYNNVVGILDYCANVCVPKRHIFFINSGGTRILTCLKKIQHSLANYGKIWASPVLALFLINIIRIK